MATDLRQPRLQKSILDPSFKYVPAVETDIRKTFARVRKEQERAALAKAAAALPRLQLLKQESKQ